MAAPTVVSERFMRRLRRVMACHICPTDDINLSRTPYACESHNTYLLQLLADYFKVNLIDDLLNGDCLSDADVYHIIDFCLHHPQRVEVVAPGWQRVLSRTTGDYYYYNPLTRTKQWESP
jgi:WW domain